MLRIDENSRIDVVEEKGYIVGGPRLVAALDSMPLLFFVKALVGFSNAHVEAMEIFLRVFKPNMRAKQVNIVLALKWLQRMINFLLTLLPGRRNNKFRKVTIVPALFYCFES